MYDILCNHICGSGLGAEQKRKGTGRLLPCFDLQILVDDVERIHLLTLVFMHPLDLYIEDRVLVKIDTFVLFNIGT